MTTDPGGGPAPRVRDKARPRDPGGGGERYRPFPHNEQLRMKFFRLLNNPEGDHACLPPEGGQNVRNGLCLRTFRYRSALMMMTWT